ncbi:uncharacterized protein LOC121298351 [Polyodon spathula]|uniref:uncharacterized protein LOC121298351 n=1 Tax=Polyodon spathula TaxID=7913 RepID=UPI001B7DC581|nr:uncharacterized protein LOC121298351 [Polyodon spathula]
MMSPRLLLCEKLAKRCAVQVLRMTADLQPLPVSWGSKRCSSRGFCSPPPPWQFGSGEPHGAPCVPPARPLGADECVSLWEQLFCERAVSEPRLSSEYIVAHVLGAKTIQRVWEPAGRSSPSQRHRYSGCGSRQAGAVPHRDTDTAGVGAGRQEQSLTETQIQRVWEPAGRSSPSQRHRYSGCGSRQAGAVPHRDTDTAGVGAGRQEQSLTETQIQRVWEPAGRSSPSQRHRYSGCGSCVHSLKHFTYVIEEWDFWDLTLKMRPPVFIPRSETEELVGLVMEELRTRGPAQDSPGQPAVPGGGLWVRSRDPQPAEPLSAGGNQTEKYELDPVDSVK